MAKKKGDDAQPGHDALLMGMTLQQWRKFCRAYEQHLQNASKEGKPFGLSRADWMWIWLTSGQANNRGQQASKSCMKRHGDKGGYTWGNVSIGTKLSNTLEGAWVPKKGEGARNKGVAMSASSNAARSSTMQTQAKNACPHCQKQMAPSHMARWHGPRCKHAPRTMP